jgi:FkbM family methyltransferase
MGDALKRRVKHVLRRTGYDIRRHQPLLDQAELFSHLCHRLQVKTVFDVGANVGHFAQSLRAEGFAEKIVCFEPLSRAHAELCDAAGGDPNWIVAPRCAVGNSSGECTINVSENEVSSSLLPMLGRHLSGAPESRYVRTETAPMITLDDFIEQASATFPPRFAVKADVQGFEMQVFEGLRRHFSQVAVMLLEISLTPLYEGQPLLPDVYSAVTNLGMKCVALDPVFRDPETRELLQVDGLFARV